MNRYGLIGRKLGHSYSQLIHKAFGRYEYFMQELEPEEVPSFLRNGSFRGLNVTIPYKKVALECCDFVSPEARRIGSVNTIVRDEDGQLHGYNTDYAGFATQASQAGVQWKSAKVLVLGTGGASLTVHTVIHDQGGQTVSVSRNGPVDYTNVAQLHPDADYIVNTTPVGMFPDNEGNPIDLAPFPRLRGVLDLIYNPMRTRLILAARERDLQTADGLPMLVEQARVAAELFLSEPLPTTLTPDIVRKIRLSTANVALIGMAGCGKSTIGRAVAQALHRDFLDTDAMVIADAGCSIPEIFANEGEAAFREREAAAIAVAAKRTGVVIATGGGAVLRKENRLNLAGNSFVFWLKRDLEKLQLRAGRPLSTDLEAARALLQQRTPLYEQLADRVIDNNSHPQNAIAYILSEMREY